MKKLLSLSCLLFVCIVSFAQNSNTTRTPSIRVQLGNIKGEVGSIAQVLANPGMVVVSQNSADTIVDYYISYVFKDANAAGNYIGPYRVKGAKFPPNVLNDLKSMRAGRIIIEHLRARSDGQVRSFGDLNVTIKD